MNVGRQPSATYCSISRRPRAARSGSPRHSSGCSRSTAPTFRVVGTRTRAPPSTRRSTKSSVAWPWSRQESTCAPTMGMSRSASRTSAARTTRRMARAEPGPSPPASIRRSSGARLRLSGRPPRPPGRRSLPRAGRGVPHRSRAERNARTQASATSTVVTRAPMARMFASLCSRPRRATSGVAACTQRMPRILLATIASPVPLPPRTMPRSYSPRATARATGAITSG